MDDEEFYVPDDVLEEASAAKYQMVPCLDDSDEWLRKSYPKTHPRGLKMVLRAVLHSKGRVEQLNIKIKLPTRRKCEYSGRDG
jgi:hypothetical protein